MKRYWIALGALVLAQVVLVWALPILPCQDLPQHLAYSRIFANYDDPNLRLEEFYRLPDHFEPYAVPYLGLAALARFTSLGFALRLVMTGYIVGLFASMHVLVEATRRRADSSLREPQWPTLLACLCVWSPAVAMGFVQFFLCIPILLAGTAGAIGWIGEHPRRRDPWLAIVSAIVLPSMHLVAAGCYVIVLAFLFAKRRSVRLAAPVAASIAAIIVWSKLGGLGVGGASRLDLQGAFRGTLALDFVTALFKLRWSDPPIIVSQIAWTVLGPYRLASLVLLATVLGTAVMALRSFGAPKSEPTLLRPIARAFAILCCIVPWGLYAPTELTFINLRMMSIGFALLVATIDPRWFATARAQRILIASCAFVVAHFGTRAIQFNREVAPVTALMARVEPNKILMSLPFHGKSDYFAKQFRLTHFMPTYYLADRGGIATQFWAKYTDHLPIDYKPGKRPSHTPDWNPDRFEPDHLKSSDYVLLEVASAEDTQEMVDKSNAARATLRAHASEIECDGAWCLYRVH
jgi:hypothetical protein